ncbi:MAG: hypothetical protein GXO97_07295 [Nitrospirae bacterium]|nr:hypothetical protein [Nitrospirota bacterium]
MTLIEIIRNTMLAGFGAQEKIKEFVDELVKKGELSESQGAKLVKEWTERAEKSTEDVTKTLSDIIAKSLEKMNLPTKDDIDNIDKKLKTLSARVKKLEEAITKQPSEQE